LGQTVITPSSSGWGRKIEDVYVYAVTPVNIPSTIMEPRCFQQVVNWIGRPCNFVVRYKASLNGFSSKLFHALCDDKGPTLTMVLLNDQRVFGGYTTSSWSGNGYGTSQRAFLFTLFGPKKQWNPILFPCNPGDAHSILRFPTLGPCFGGGYDLYIPLDDMSKCSSNVGVSYALPEGLSQANGKTILAGTHNQWGLDVADIEVIIVEELSGVSPLSEANVTFSPQKDKSLSTSPRDKTKTVSTANVSSKPKPTPKPNSKPLPNPSPAVLTLQTPDWSSLYRDIDFINRYKPRYGEELKLTTTNILLFGGFGSGKSSFINSAYSVISNRLEFVAPVSGGRDHATIFYERYPLLDLPIELRDTWGWSETNYQGDEVTLMLDGAMPNKTHMDALAKGDVPLKKNTTFADAAHVVILFIPATAVSDSRGYIEKFDTFLKVVRSRDIQCLIVVSMVDLIDPTLTGHIEKTFQSKAVQKAVSAVATTTGIPPNLIFPLINYYQHVTGKNQYIEKMVAMILIRALEQADGLFLRKFNEQRLNPNRALSNTAVQKPNASPEPETPPSGQPNSKTSAEKLPDLSNLSLEGGTESTSSSLKKKKFQLTLYVKIEGEPDSSFEEMYITKPTIKELKRRICEKYAPRLPESIVSIKKLVGENRSTKINIVDDANVAMLKDETFIEVTFQTERWS
jgi:hypothetical protein